MNTASPLRGLLELADVALALGRQNRATFHQDGETPESDTTHSIMLALLAFEVADTTDTLDPYRVAVLAVVHDLVEAIAGDTNTLGGLTEAQRAEKAAREARALDQLRARLRGMRVLELLEEYEAGTSPEAQFVRYLDKVTPKLTHALNGCVAVERAGHDAAWLEERCRAQGAELAAKYPGLVEVVGPVFDAACRVSERALRARRGEGAA